MLYSITPSPAHVHDGSAIAQLLSAIHQTGHSESIDLSISGTSDGTSFQANVPNSMRSLFLAAAADLLPDCRVEPVSRARKETPELRRFAVLRLQPECYSINDGVGSLDPASAILAALRTGKAGAIETKLMIRLRRASPRRRDKLERLAARMQWKIWPAVAWRAYKRLALSQRPITDAFADILRHVCIAKRRPMEGVDTKLQSHLLECQFSVEVSGPTGSQRLINHKLVDIVGSLGGYTNDRYRFHIVSMGRSLPSRWKRTSLLTPAEIQAIWHPPAGKSRIARLSRAPIHELEPPDCLIAPPDPSATVIGRAVYRGQKQAAFIGPSDRLRHTFVIGRTGCGKSTLLHNMIVDDIGKDRAVCLIDPHGDLTESLLDHVPKHRTNDVLLFDAGDRSRPVAFNPLATGGRLDPVLVADGVVTAFQKVFGFDPGQAPRLLHIFRNCLLALVSHSHDATLISVQRMLVDEPFRRQRVQRIENPAVRQFWLEEFGRWRPSERIAYVASLQNKLGAYLSNPLLAAVFGQSRNRIDFRALMDEGQRIVLINLSKGKVGNEASQLLGALLVSGLQTAALSRAELPESRRREFYVYLDEFSNFLAEGNDTFATILSESRKYRTGYTLVTQFVDSLDAQTRAAVFGNCGNLIAMQCGIDDARIMADQLGGGLSPDPITELPRFHAYVRLSTQSGATRPFAIATPPPREPRHLRSEAVRKYSRQRYGRDRNTVDSEIRTAYGA